MGENNGVYGLIHSLTKTEKRSFRMYVSTNSGPTARMSIALFDTLLKLPMDDAGLLRKHWPLSEFPKHLLPMKSKLFALILKSLRNLQHGKTVDSELRRLLEEIQFLFSKGLIPDCEKRLRKAHALAEKYEKEEVRLQLIQWERRVFESQAREGQAVFFQDLLARETICISRMQEHSTLALLNERIRALARVQQQARTPGQQVPFQAIMEHPLLHQLPVKDRLFARIYYLNTWGIQWIIFGNPTAAFPFLHQNMEIWHEHPHFINEKPELYLGILNNYLSSCLFSDTFYDHFHEGIRLTRNLEGLPMEVRLKFQRVCYYQELAHAMNFAGYETGIKLIPEIETWLETNRKKISHYILLVFYYNISVFHFVNDDFPGAHKWLTKILQESDGGERQDILDFARIFQLIIQLELGNFDLNEYLLRSANRYFRKTEKMLHFESLLIQAIQQVLKNPTTAEDIYKDLRSGLQVIREDGSGQNPLGLGELLLWTEGKLSGKGTRHCWELQMVENRKIAKDGG